MNDSKNDIIIIYLRISFHFQHTWVKVNVGFTILRSVFMKQLNECNYVNPSKVSLDWECFVVSKSDMELDGLPKELINSWMAQNIIERFSIRNNEINFKTQDIRDALRKQNWYYDK